MEVLRTDVAIVGGGLGACAAALAAARLGRRVILTEETHWVGGQLTNQAVPPDEHPWIEEYGATASYRALRRGIRDYYRAYTPLTPSARALGQLNPGNGWVSRLCHDPRVAVAVLHQMMVPHQLSGRLFLLEPHRPVTAWTHGDRVVGVVVRGIESGRDSLIEAPFFIDATPYGDLLDLADVEYVVGAESRSETGEPHAREQPDPRDQQAITVCFAIEHLPGEDHTIDKPRQYELWREFRPAGWPGPLLSWTTMRPETNQPLTRLLFEAEDDHPWWRFRRILDRTNFEESFARSDIVVVNWPQNDYWFGPVIGVDQAEQARHLEAARQLSLSLLYWLQTEAPRPTAATVTLDCAFAAMSWAGRRTGSHRPPMSGNQGAYEPSSPYSSSTSPIRSGPTAPSYSATRWGSAATGSTCIPGSAEPATSISAAGHSRSRSAR